MPAPTYATRRSQGVGARRRRHQPGWRFSRIMLAPGLFKRTRLRTLRSRSSSGTSSSPPRNRPTPTSWAMPIADHLRAQPGFSVKSVSLNDPGQGLADGVLDDCHVLIWWGHVRQWEIAPEVGRSIVQKIKAGQLSLIALHSAHWSTPFVEAMNERTRHRRSASRCGPSHEDQLELT